jgi:hypothetical protein
MLLSQFLFHKLELLNLLLLLCGVVSEGVDSLDHLLLRELEILHATLHNFHSRTAFVRDVTRLPIRIEICLRDGIHILQNLKSGVFILEDTTVSVEI